jgi:hypothetical protein
MSAMAVSYIARALFRIVANFVPWALALQPAQPAWNDNSRLHMEDDDWQYISAFPRAPSLLSDASDLA